MDQPKADRLRDLIAAYDADVTRRGALDLPQWRIDTIDPWLDALPVASDLLELGAGTGQLARHVADRGFAVTAVDLSPGNVAATQGRGIEAIQADFADLPFGDATFRGAFAFNSLLHVPRNELPGVYAEIRRVLEVGAPLLVVVWGGEDSAGPYDDDWLDPPRFFNFFSDEAMWAQPTPGFDKLDLSVIAGAVSRQLEARAFRLVAT